MTNTFILKWNPTRWPWPDEQFDEAVTRTAAGSTVSNQWSVGGRCHVFGLFGQEFIHIHHLRELAEIGEEYVVDPAKDLRPICPNCHAMVHRTRPALTIAALKKRLRTSQRRNAG